MSKMSFTHAVSPVRGPCARGLTSTRSVNAPQDDAAAAEDMARAPRPVAALLRVLGGGGGRRWSRRLRGDIRGQADSRLLLLLLLLSR